MQSASRAASRTVLTALLSHYDDKKLAEEEDIADL